MLLLLLLLLLNVICSACCNGTGGNNEREEVEGDEEYGLRSGGFDLYDTWVDTCDEGAGGEVPSGVHLQMEEMSGDGVGGPYGSVYPLLPKVKLSPDSIIRKKI